MPAGVKRGHAQEAGGHAAGRLVLLVVHEAGLLCRLCTEEAWARPGGGCK